jgi:hypothetical protein
MTVMQHPKSSCTSMRAETRIVENLTSYSSVPCWNRYRAFIALLSCEGSSVTGQVKLRVPSPVVEASCRAEHAAMLGLVEAIQKTWAMQHENVSKNLPGSTSTPHEIAKGVADLGGKCLPWEKHAAARNNSAGSSNSNNCTADVLPKEGNTAAMQRTSVCVRGEPAGNRLYHPPLPHFSIDFGTNYQVCYSTSKGPRRTAATTPTVIHVTVLSQIDQTPHQTHVVSSLL